MSAARIGICYNDGGGRATIAISDDSAISWGTVRPTPDFPEAFAHSGSGVFSVAAGAYRGGVIAMFDVWGLLVVSYDEGLTFSVISTFDDSPGGAGAPGTSYGFFPYYHGGFATGNGFIFFGDWYHPTYPWALVRSFDGGVTWDRQAITQFTDTASAGAYNESSGTALIGSYQDPTTELIRSTDNFATWALVAGHGLSGGIRRIEPGDAGEWWVVTDVSGTRHLYYSNDDGLTFSEVTFPSGMTVWNPQQYGQSITYSKYTGILYASGYTGTYPGSEVAAVAWSLDKGATWSTPVEIGQLNDGSGTSVAGTFRYIGDDTMFIANWNTYGPQYIRSVASPTPTGFEASTRLMPGDAEAWFIISLGTTPATSSPPPVQPSVPTQVLPRVFELLNGPDLSATCLASFDGLEMGRLEFRVDNQDRGDLSVDEDAAWLALVDTDLLLRITDHNDRVSEWRIEEIKESEEGDGRAHLVLRPLYTDLGRVVVRQEVVGGETQLAITVANMTPEEVWDQILAPQMPSWANKGTIAPTQKVSTTQTGWSIQQWLDWLAKETDHEVYPERLGAGNYDIHIIPERGSGAKEVTVMAQKQLLELERTRRLGNLATHLLPIGMVVPGATQPAGFGQNAWVVVDVDTGADYIDIEDPDGADTPVFFDDEFNTTTVPGIEREPHVIRTDGSLAQILDTVLTGGVSRLYLDDATGFSIGDHVTIVKNANGTHLPGLYDPAAVAARGVIDGTVELQALRGERNYAPNSEPRNWTVDGEGYAGKSDGGSSGSSLPLREMLPGTFIPTGSLVHLPSPGVQPWLTTTDETVDGSGDVTLSLSGSLVTSDGQVVHISVTPSPPDDWTASGPFAAMWRTSRDQTVIVCDADGDQTDTLYLAVKNLTPGQWIPWGWEVGGVRIIQETTADGSGNAVLHLAGVITVADDDALTIQGLLMGTDAGAQDRVMALVHGHPATPVLYETLPIAVFPQGYPVYAQAWLTSENGDWDYGASVSNWWPPRMQIIPSTDPAVTVWDQDRASYPTPFDFRLRAGSPASPTVQTYKVRIYPPEYTLTPQYETVTAGFYCRGVMLHTGPDPDAPFVYGSHADPMWHSVHRALGLYGTPETSYVITMRDLSALIAEGYVQADNILTLGGNLRIVSKRFGEDIVRRIMVYIVDLVTPENSGVILDQYTPELTRILVEIRQLQQVA